MVALFSTSVDVFHSGCKIRIMPLQIFTYFLSKLPHPKVLDIRTIAPHRRTFWALAAVEAHPKIAPVNLGPRINSSLFILHMHIQYASMANAKICTWNFSHSHCIRGCRKRRLDDGCSMHQNPNNAITRRHVSASLDAIPFPSTTHFRFWFPQGSKKDLRVVARHMLTHVLHLTPFQHTNPSIDPRRIDTIWVLSYILYEDHMHA